MELTPNKANKDIVAAEQLAETKPLSKTILGSDKPTSLKLQNLARELANKPTRSSLKTIAEHEEEERQDAQAKFRSFFLNGVTLTGALTSAMALFSNLVLDKNSKTSKFINSLSEKSAALSFGSYGAIGAADAYQNNKTDLMLPQILGVLTPALTSDYDNLTLNRGLDIGALNIASESNRISGNSSNSGVEDAQDLVANSKMILSELFTNPIRTLTDFNSGKAGMFWGKVTALSTVVYKLTGARKISTILRQAGGLLAEGGKLALDNLRKGRILYWTSGMLLSGSSLTNLASAFVPDNLRRPVENLTWILNIFGKKAQVQALNSGELANTEEKEIQWSELPRQILTSMFSLSKNQTKLTSEKEESVLFESNGAKPKVKAPISYANSVLLGQPINNKAMTAEALASNAKSSSALGLQVSNSQSVNSTPDAKQAPLGSASKALTDKANTKISRSGVKSPSSVITANINGSSSSDRPSLTRVSTKSSNAKSSTKTQFA